MRALLLAVLPLPALAQEVVPCDPAPPVTALIEPWEETTAALAGGAVRLAVIEGEEGSRRLLVLTLPPADAGVASDSTAPPTASPTAPPPERRCRIVTGAGLGFADLDLAGLAAEEDAGAGTLTLRLPGLGFLPESTELIPETLVLTFTVADDGLAAVVEGEPGEAAPGEAGADAPP